MSTVEKLVGGLADGKTLKDIAEHHKLDFAAIVEQYKMGQKVEMEHTQDFNVACDIARDHLWEDSKYYSKLKEMEKIEPTHTEVTVDGKREIVPGTEPLKKPLTKSLKERWDLLKAKVSADDAFLKIGDYTDDKPENAPPEGNSQGQPQDAEGGQGGTPPESGLSPEEEAQLAQQPATEEQPSQEDAAPAEGPDSNLSPEQIAQMMADEGYSQGEIAHVMDGHVPPVATAEDHAATNELMDGEQDRFHSQREADAKHEHMTKLHEIEQRRKAADLEANDPAMSREHAKRLKDLEYEKAKKAFEAEDHEGEKAHKQKLRDIELEAKRRELELKSDEGEKKHKDRMRELEYLKAKKESEKEDPTEAMKAKELEAELKMKLMEKQIELEFKKKELMLKLKIQEESARQKAEFAAAQAEEDAKVTAAVKKEQAKFKIADAKKPPVKEEPTGKGKIDGKAN